MWDIYGNRLRQGYCEVHPDVHQEYPCIMCYAANKKDEQRRRDDARQRSLYEEEERKEFYKHYKSEGEGI